MKRQRDEDVNVINYQMMDWQMEETNMQFMTPPRNPNPSFHSFFPRIPECNLPPLKRCRDISVPIDAMSRMMSAAVTLNRREKRQLNAWSSLFSKPNTKSNLCLTKSPACYACQHPSVLVAQCFHCEQRIGNCCERRCEACFNTFCSLCSTLNCEQQYDRVFCLACNKESV